jgi:hypothetical protein
MYFLLSCPLPTGLGVCVALVESSLILIGLLVFSASLLSFMSSVVGAVEELIDSTKAFNNRKHDAASSLAEDMPSEPGSEIQLEEIAGGKAFGGGDAVMDETVMGMVDTLPSYESSERSGEARQRLAIGGDASTE